MSINQTKIFGMDQKIEYIDIKDLVLWTENPRDPIDEDAIDQDIVDNALSDKQSRWTLPKLAKEMGAFYDLSELPTVVYHGEKPVVYDGNRRIILGKIKYKLVTIANEIKIQNFLEKMPCNVCSKEIALNNVYRKHSSNGSWKPLERDIFLHKHMKEPKSTFLILDDSTRIISSNPNLNKRFVKDEIFKEDLLKPIGFTIQGDKLYSVHNEEESRLILSDISRQIEEKNISTRESRRNIIGTLGSSSLQLIDKNKNNRQNICAINFSNSEDKNEKQRRSKRTPKKENELFGEKLCLNEGDVNDLYRDIVDLHKFYINKKEDLSKKFPNLIRMSLRLLCEVAAAKNGKKPLDKYLETYFADAKKELSQDMKTTLSTQSVSELNKIKQLLNTGAHDYSSSNNMEQTIALSIIIGAMLKISHGR